jgi:hypothetical protein
MTGSPRLWLKCGTCNDATLARLSTDAQPLPGEPYGVERWPGGRWEARPAWDRDGWTHEFQCKTCGAGHQVRDQRLAGWWAEFAASGKRRGDRYIDRDD